MKRYRNLKISTKLTAIFLIVILILTLSIGYLVTRISANFLLLQIEERFMMEASDHMQTIDIIMDNNYHRIQSFAQEEVLTRGTSTPGEIEKFLKKIKEIYGYVSLSYYDMNRIGIADTEGLNLGRQHALERYWEDISSGKVSAGSDVRVSEDHKITIIYFASAVKNIEGKAIGVLVARLNSKDIIHIVEGKKAKELQSTLIDREGKVLFSSCEDLKKLELKGNLLGLLSTKSALSGQDGIVLEYYPYCKKEYFTAYTHEKGWHDFKGNNWSLLISFGKDEAMAPLQSLIKAIIGMLIIVVLVVLGFVPFLVRSITKSIIKLTKVIKKIEAGDLNQRIEIISGDEIGELSCAFNQMVGNLKNSYEKITSYNKDLEEKVKEKTRDLNEKLDELKKSQTAMLYMIEDLNRQSKELRDAQDKVIRSEKLAIIGQLASSVAHELRNPLGVMKNTLYYLNMLETGKNNPEIQENLDIISEEIANSDRIISDLLDFGRIKESILRPENINIIVKETLLRLGQHPEVEIITELNEALPLVLADAVQLQQIFLNLAANAFQSMEKPGKLTIKTQISGEFAEILFVDTGCGIPKENLNKIFEPLFSSKAKGTGLGLSICNLIIGQHKGIIEVESEVGKGSLFRVKLPV